MKIIALLNEKGGVGKTALATNIATAMHRQGRRVIIVDADPQGTARDWRAVTPGGVDLPSVVCVDRPQDLDMVLKGLNADVVVIDTPAKAAQTAASVVRFADVALIVIQPSGPDVWASAATVKLIQSRIDAGGLIDAAFLINRANPLTKLSKLVKAGTWNDYAIEQLSSTVGNRVSFAQTATDGVSVFESADQTAKNEILNIVKELENARWL